MRETQPVAVNVPLELQKTLAELLKLEKAMDILGKRIADRRCYVDALKRVQNHFNDHLETSESSNPSSSSSSCSSSSSIPISESAAPVTSACLEIFRQEHGPLRLSFIEKRLRERGVRVGRNTAWMAIKRLEQRHRIRKRSRGVYELMNGSS
ncbi:MAG: hypothetical protein HYT90_01145 [Candidatus Omnitrophica bacterium]|nr:hypothetical protein [Candidatus Omnitrophota bacterium]